MGVSTTVKVSFIGVKASCLVFFLYLLMSASTKWKMLKAYFGFLKHQLDCLLKQNAFGPNSCEQNFCRIKKQAVSTFLSSHPLWFSFTSRGPYSLLGATRWWVVLWRGVTTLHWRLQAGVAWCQFRCCSILEGGNTPLIGVPCLIALYNIAANCSQCNSASGEHPNRAYNCSFSGPFLPILHVHPIRCQQGAAQNPVYDVLIEPFPSKQNSYLG